MWPLRATVFFVQHFHTSFVGFAPCHWFWTNTTVLLMEFFQTAWLKTNLTPTCWMVSWTIKIETGTFKQTLKLPLCWTKCDQLRLCFADWNGTSVPIVYFPFETDAGISLMNGAVWTMEGKVGLVSESQKHQNEQNCRICLSLVCFLCSSWQVLSLHKNSSKLTFQIRHGIQTDHNSQQYVSFGDLSAACMTTVDVCIPTGGSFAFWIQLIDCPHMAGILTTYARQGGPSGFYIRNEGYYAWVLYDRAKVSCQDTSLSLTSWFLSCIAEYISLVKHVPTPPIMETWTGSSGNTLQLCLTERI